MSESVTNAPETRDPPAERRQVSVLFADMVGYTATVEELGEEKASAFTAQVHDILAETVRRHGGTVRAFAGDSIMAVFGIPTAQEDAALRACRAGLALHDRLAAAAEDMAARFGARPVMRVGVSSGTAIIAPVEGAGAPPTAIGNTVNLASRIQALAPPGGCLICDETRALVEWVADLAPAGEQAIRGLSRPQRLWTLHAIRDGASRFDASRARGLTPLVGRARELATLSGARAAARDGRSAVGLVGEPGLGKTRLVFEFLRRADGDGAEVLTGHCLADGQQTPFFPFLEVLRRAFAIARADDPATITAKITTGLAELGLDSAENRALLLNLLGMGGEGAAQDARDGVLVGLRIRDLLPAMLRALCARQPVILLIEDIHWIDSASEALLAAILARDDLRRLMLLTTRRPEYTPPWAESGAETVIPLASLAEEDIRRIVQGRLGVEELPPALVAQVAERAGGNPLFGEEILSFLLQQGALRLSEGRAEFDAAEGQSSLPVSVQSLLAARVDRLPPGDRRLLQAAAVIGRRFDPDLLARVTGRPEEIAGALRRLQDSGLVAPVADGGLVPGATASADHAFRHVLLRDSVYLGLLSDQRAALHLAVAEALESRHAGRLTEVVDSLAFHYAQTDRHDRAFRYGALAGTKALGVYTLDQASRYFAAALALREAHPDAVEDAAFAAMLADYALCLNISMRARTMFDLADKVMPFFDSHGDSRARVHFLHHYIACLCCDARYRHALTVQQDLTAMAQRRGDPESLAYALACEIALNCYIAPLTPEVLEAKRAQAEAALATFEDAYLKNFLWAYLGYDKMVRGRVAEANAISREMIAMGSATNDARALGYGTAMLALIAMCTDDYEFAVEQSERALRVCRVDWETGIATCTRIAAQIPLQKPGAVREATEFIGRCGENAWAIMAAGPETMMGVAMVMEGRISDGLRHLEEVVARREAEGYQAAACWARLYLCEVYLAILSGQGDASLKVLLRNAGTLARVFLTGGRRIEALLAEVRAHEQFDPEGHYIARAEMIVGLLYVIRKKRVSAIAHLSKALHIVAPGGASAMRSRIEAALDRLGVAVVRP